MKKRGNLENWNYFWLNGVVLILSLLQWMTSLDKPLSRHSNLEIASIFVEFIQFDAKTFNGDSKIELHLDFLLFWNVERSCCLAKKTRLKNFWSVNKYILLWTWVSISTIPYSGIWRVYTGWSRKIETVLLIFDLLYIRDLKRNLWKNSWKTFIGNNASKFH